MKYICKSWCYNFIKMNQEICRLCLSNNHLGQLFTNMDQIWIARQTNDLCITTGLKIEFNDGLPQQICQKCTELVNSALELRNQANLSEIKLLSLGYEFGTEIKNISPLGENHTESIENNDDIANNSKDNDDNYRLPEIQIEVELDRITDEKYDCQEKKSNEAMETISIQPNTKKISRKEKRELYLSLVDGNFDPEGPVKCKVCRKTVSKWACFISHAKLHLGFDFMCEFCGKKFISSTHLKRHSRSFHGMQRELACKHCNYLALDKAQLVLHERRTHTGERPYVCDLCAASYFSRRCLVQHIESHRTIASVQCEQCPQVFKSARHAARHRYSAHTHAPRRLRCTHCANSYTRKYMRVHVAKHHPPQPTETCPDQEII